MTAGQNNQSAGQALHTDDPVALAYLMSETLFNVGEGTGVAEIPAAVEKLVETPAAAPEITYLGKNQSGFLFVFQDHSTIGQHSLPAPEMEAFEKILTALNLSIEHIALLNIAHSVTVHSGGTHSDQVTLNQLLTFFNPQKMILLGTQLTISGLEQLPDPLTPHQTVTYQQTAFLHTFSFSEMMADTDRKRIFWNSLKALINP